MHQRGLVEHAIGVARALAALVLFRERCHARCGGLPAASIDEWIGHEAHELRHRVEGGLLAANSGFARHLRQRVRERSATQPEQVDEARRQRAAIVEEFVERGRNVLLVAIDRRACRNPEHRVEVEQHVIAGVAQAGGEAGRQAGRGKRVEGGAAEAGRRCENRIVAGHIASRRELCADSARQAGGTGNVGARRSGRADLNPVGSTGLKGDTVGNSHGAARNAGAGRERTENLGGRHGAGAAERSRSVDVAGGPVDNQRAARIHHCGSGRNRAAGRDNQGAPTDAGDAGIGVDARQRQRARPELVQSAADA